MKQLCSFQHRHTQRARECVRALKSGTFSILWHASVPPGPPGPPAPPSLHWSTAALEIHAAGAEASSPSAACSLITCQRGR